MRSRFNVSESLRVAAFEEACLLAGVAERAEVDDVDFGEIARLTGGDLRYSPFNDRMGEEDEDWQDSDTLSELKERQERARARRDLELMKFELDQKKLAEQARIWVRRMGGIDAYAEKMLGKRESQFIKKHILEARKEGKKVDLYMTPERQFSDGVSDKYKTGVETYRQRASANESNLMGEASPVMADGTIIRQGRQYDGSEGGRDIGIPIPYLRDSHGNVVKGYKDSKEFEIYCCWQKLPVDQTRMYLVKDVLAKLAADEDWSRLKKLAGMKRVFREMMGGTRHDVIKQELNGYKKVWYMEFELPNGKICTIFSPVTFDYLKEEIEAKQAKQRQRDLAKEAMDVKILAVKEQLEEYVQILGSDDVDALMIVQCEARRIFEWVDINCKWEKYATWKNGGHGRLAVLWELFKPLLRISED